MIHVDRSLESQHIHQYLQEKEKSKTLKTKKKKKDFTNPFKMNKN